ncbi:helix-turn-helix domain-containing protein [Nocardioides nitrophenolicus]|uniref:helix-turn-helix domain-containing protein n=1 Tax=Nocardioides nitrophenolicus TaxID=60489 RepID=UPI00195E555A|nr:helix-turn-helix transcriptional regulator [Nocardioides nitrophenolicus]MBM7520322.1 DNA-binding transcriptional regulator YiaG [Nocardioides nitrophenolicus]
MTRSPASVPTLPTAVLLEDTVQDVRRRADRIEARDPATGAAWERWEAEQGRKGPATFAAVLASFVALAVLDDPEDVDRAATLGAELGLERVAQLQHRAGRVLELDDDRPLTTTVVHRLLAAQDTADLGRALLFAGVDVETGTTHEVAAVRSALVAFARGGSVAAGRRALGRLAAEPWGPLAEELVEGADAADLEIVETLVGWSREWRTDQDRRLVGRQVQRLVALSGVTQRQFAARIGTSPSRLSSYVTGSVTPSATLLLRMQRSARAFRGELGPASTARA